TLAVSTTGIVEFNDADDLTVGRVAAGGGAGFTGAAGITSGNNDINLQTGASLTVNQTVNAGTANVTLTANNNGAITLTATLDGNFALAVKTGGNITFNGVVGGTTPLKSLTIDNGGPSSAIAAIQGSGTTFTKNGNGTFILAANNTYTGNTTVNA